MQWCARSLFPSLRFAFLPPRSQAAVSSAAAPARGGERARDDDQPAPERAFAAGLPVSSEKLELNTLKELLAQNLTELDQITRQMRTRHLNPGSAVFAAAASSRVPGPERCIPSALRRWTCAARAARIQRKIRGRSIRFFRALESIARRTDRSSPRRGGTAAAAAGAPPWARRRASTSTPCECRAHAREQRPRAARTRGAQ